MTEPTDTAGSVATPQPSGIDPRGPRFGAAIIAALLVVVLLLAPSADARVVLALVVLLFLIAVVAGPVGSVQGRLFRWLVLPRLAPATQSEDSRPLRFADLLGLGVTALGLGLDLLGIPYAMAFATDLMLVTAFLHAAFRFCLGCEVYLWLTRRGVRPGAAR